MVLRNCASAALVATACLVLSVSARADEPPAGPAAPLPPSADPTVPDPSAQPLQPAQPDPSAQPWQPPPTDPTGTAAPTPPNGAPPYTTIYPYPQIVPYGATPVQPYVQPPPDPVLVKYQKDKRQAKGIAIGGVAGIGMGWILSVVHGLFGELAGVDCQSTGWGLGLNCTDTDDYRGIYVPVVGPIIEGATHRGELSTADHLFFVVESIFQLGGAAALIGGLATWPDKPTQRPAVNLTITPVAVTNGAGFGLTGTW